MLKSGKLLEDVCVAPLKIKNRKGKLSYNGPLTRERIGSAFDMVFKYQFSEGICVKIGLLDN